MSDAHFELAPNLKRATRLEWWTLAWMSSVVLVMYMASGGSQAFRTALFEDVLSLIPAIVFLIAARFEKKPPTRLFPYGFHRVNSLAFLIAAVALASVGGFLLFEAVMTLVRQEHPSVPPTSLFGQTVWSGWVMIAALVYSVIPPLILGRLKLPVARELNDKVLHTDALMQKADWMTGLAGVAGIVGIGFGLWWADAVAAGFIAFDIVTDGVSALKRATAELIDGTPRKIDTDEVADDAAAIQRWLEERHPGADVRLRESGRFIRANVSGAMSPEQIETEALDIPGVDKPWRLESVTFAPPDPSRTPSRSARSAPPAYRGSRSRTAPGQAASAS